MNTKNNKTYQDNEQAIREAFLTLLDADADQVITVRDICKVSGVNRSTFYRHYLDIYDLMEQTERAIFNEWFAELSEVNEIRECFYSKEGILILLRNMERNRIFYRYYLRNHPDALKENAFAAIWEEFFIPYFRQWGIKDSKDMEYYFTYYQGGMRSVALKWLEEGCKETPEHIVEILVAISLPQNVRPVNAL